MAGVSLPLFHSAENSDLQETLSLYGNDPPAKIATDETFWFQVRQAYDVSTNLVNLNNGGVSPSPRVVLEAFEHYNRLANQLPAYYLFRDFKEKRAAVKKQLAGLAGCNPEEIALCRNATEALETCIFGLNLKKGEEILTTTQDYPSMLISLEQRTRRDGIILTKLTIPVPVEDEEEIVSIFEKAITKNTRAILVCHVINLTGQIMPIKKISDMAHNHGLEVICDGAHSFAHFDFNIPDLHCDYFGTSLHKWLGAPFGCGMLWVKKEKIEKLWPLFGGPEDQIGKINKFDHLGTRSFPAELAISEAIDFHMSIGPKRKEARLRYLKNYWAEKVKNMKGLKLLTSFNDRFACGIATFAIEGKDMGKVAKSLHKNYGLYTSRINHEDVNGIRVSPNIYSSLRHLDRLVEAIDELQKG